MNSKTDLVAKLLANENLTVIQGAVRTASFDIKNRVLRLPQWKDMTDDLLDMLVGHEVGHALYTTLEEYSTKNPYKDLAHFSGYMNVLEDVRIEKLMKRRYPGLRKSFNAGYKELNTRDFFGIANGNFKDMLLIDKINLYFKAGYACGVEFTPEEKAFVRRAEETETCDDVITLAKEIYDYSKKAMEDKLEEMKAQSDDHEFEEDEEEEPDNQPQDQDFEEVSGDEEEADDSDDTEQNQQPSPSQDTLQDLEDSLEDQLESQTEKNLKNKIEELADTSIEYKYVTIPKQFPVSPLVTYKEVFEEFATCDDNYKNNGGDGLLSDTAIEDADKFKASSKNVVSYLVKEFEMRKSAQNYKRAKIGKTGSLDGKKLYAYKLNDDIFKQVMSIPNGKNHGMIFLLDWSASMDHVLKPTIEQVISLAMFCRGAQIPFQVFAFSNGWSDRRYRNEDGTRKIVASDSEVDIYGLAMLELFSSKMTQSEFNKMVTLSLSRWFHHIGNLKTSGTPLNAALAWLYNYIPEFKSKNGAEKMTLITLSDGEGEFLRTGVDQIRMRRQSTADYKAYITVKPFLSDTVTRKNYPMSESAEQTKSLLQMIKGRHQITTVGFYITRPTYRYLHNAFVAHYGHGSHVSMYAIENMKKEMRKNGYATMSDTGRDELFVIAESRTKIEDESELTISKGESASRIARELTKKLSNKKTSRILLNSFVGLIA
jgi:hypothetical protein